jgi:hypothetical protein
MVLCDPYIWQDPNILYKTFVSIGLKKECFSEIINSIIGVTLLALLVGGSVYLRFGSLYPLLFILLVVFIILIPDFLSYGNIVKPVEPETFTTYIEPPKVPSQTNSTARNPFMNVLIDEIKYNPTRLGAADVSSIDNKMLLDDFFRVQFTSDPTDVFGRTQSQRQFITMPSTTVPNDQSSYQNWLYKIPGKTCKEGGREACLPGTDGGKLPWNSVER